MIFMIIAKITLRREVSGMKMERVLIQLPTDLKARLDGLRSQGFTISGYIRALLERELNHPKKKGV